LPKPALLFSPHSPPAVGTACRVPGRGWKLAPRCSHLSAPAMELRPRDRQDAPAVACLFPCAVSYKTLPDYKGLALRRTCSYLPHYPPLNPSLIPLSAVIPKWILPVRTGNTLWLPPVPICPVLNSDSDFLRAKSYFLITRKTLLQLYNYKFTSKHQRIFQYCQSLPGLM